MTLRKNSHLKHFGRLQYTLFLKGLGLTMEDCLIFWRLSFKLITDDTFNKEYRYNIRHAYGDVGGDAIRRGRGYSPFSCQKILTEHPPGSGESHGCPYRHFSVDNLSTLLQATGVSDRDVLRGVKEDVDKKRYHIACNRVLSGPTRTRSGRSRRTVLGKRRIWTPSYIPTLTSREATCSNLVWVANQGEMIRIRWRCKRSSQFLASERVLRVDDRRTTSIAPMTRPHTRPIIVASLLA